MRAVVRGEGRGQYFLFIVGTQNCPLLPPTLLECRSQWGPLWKSSPAQHLLG